ncbi:MAG: ribbon-helix-helix protein, CopG family [Acidimicrobiales bacterium]
MRTTVDLDPDTAKAVEQLRREHGTGLSEAVNQLIRRGLLAPASSARFEPIHRELGITIDVSDVADALDLLEGPEAR